MTIQVIKLAFLFILILLLTKLYSQVQYQDQYIEISPWEPEDIKPIYYDVTQGSNYETSPFILMASQLISLYQQEIGPKSVSRCPFFVSCSNYAYHAINHYGLVIGMALFIDRNFYRENVGSHLHYTYRETNSGVLKLDDSNYLFRAFSK